MPTRAKDLTRKFTERFKNLEMEIPKTITDIEDFVKEIIGKVDEDMILAFLLCYFWRDLQVMKTWIPKPTKEDIEIAKATLKGLIEKLRELIRKHIK